jgi:hypothetical protein
MFKGKKRLRQICGLWLSFEAFTGFFLSFF